MSSLLEQAIVDAAALKEAAIKNAESLVLEKHASELKEAINSILEQDPSMLPGMDSGIDSLGSSEMTPTENPLAAKIPMAATNGEKLCPCPDDEEEIEINFDQLAQQMNGGDQTNPSGLPGQMGELPSDETSMMEGEPGGVQVPAQLGPELHQYHMSMGDPIYKVGSMAYAGRPVPPELVQQAADSLSSMVGKMGDPEENEQVQQLADQLQGILDSNSQSREDEMITTQAMPEADYDQNLYEDLDLSQIDEQKISDILETLVVDMKPVPHGHVGHATSSERIDAGEIALARTQDTKIAEENKELKKALEKIQESNKMLSKQVSSLNLEFNKVKGIAMTAGRKLNELNLENAKLVYTNRALKSNSLNERQKATIVENISKVGSVEEAKIVFETLEKSVNFKSVKNPESLTEALNFNKGNSLPFKSSKTTENNNNPLKDRYQKIAGIKKSQ
jgi:hypothetical protein